MDEVLNYWFEYSPSNIALSEQSDMHRSFDRWFRGKEDEVQHSLWNSFSKEANHWPDTPSGHLARVVFYDQIPRGCFRGTRQAFAYDEQALIWANRFLNAAHLAPMNLDSPICLSHVFIALICLSHSEKADVQQRSLDLSAEFSQNVWPLNWLSQGVKRQLAQVHQEAQQHYDIVHMFGRFPHRNQVLNRASTPEENQFLNQSILPPWMQSQSLKRSR